MTDGAQGRPPGRILLIEDDPVAAHFAMHVLGKRGGFDVRHTPDPAVALRLAGSQTWDLVLTDLELPGMTSRELLAALRKFDPALPVAVITAHEPSDTALQALRNEADEFLQKPVRPEQLLATVTALVVRGRAARDATRVAARQAVLAVGAHPDDVEIGAAGTLLHHRALGHEVSILTLTRDGRGGAAGTSAGGSELAALALGATLLLPDLPDSVIGEGDPTISAISRAVQEVRPAVVYTHSPHDAHRDHRNTHLAAMAACREVGHVYCFQSPSATVDFRPTRFVTIDEQLDRKLLAVNAFAARQQAREYLAEDLVKSTARYWSRYADGHYAEPFEVIRESAAIAGQPADPVPGPAAGPEDCYPDGCLFQALLRAEDGRSRRPGSPPRRLMQPPPRSLVQHKPSWARSAGRSR